MNDKYIILDYAMQFVGVPYIWGGSNPIDGFDCSGFIQEILASVGRDPRNDQTAQALHDELIKTAPSSNVGPGALIFYGKSTTQITHVNMAIAPHLCIGAMGGGPSCLTKEDAAKKNAFVKIRPINYRDDVVAIVNIFEVTENEHKSAA